MTSVGIDVGGTKLESVLLGEDGAELDRRRTPTPVGDYAGIVAAIAGLVEAIEVEFGPVDAVGMGTPGTEDRTTGLLKHSNSVALNGMPLRHDVEDRLRRPVAIANDADCLALSEAMDGAGAGYASVFAVILGTGVGGGVVVRRRLVTGPNGLAGEWGHNPLPSPRADELPGLPCYCGRSGCIETWLSGPSLSLDHARHTGIDAAAGDIASAAERGDADASATIERYADRLARGLASIVNAFDPEAIVMGGGVSNIDQLYQLVPSLWDRYVFGETVTTPLVRARHGDSSGVRGAAYLGAAGEVGGS